jgi:hypothetical protein
MRLFLIAALVVVIAAAVAAMLLSGPSSSGPVRLDGAHDLVYEDVVFSGSGSGKGDDSGLVYITGASHDIVFRDCVFETNQDGVGNGVKIVDSGRGMHDITFVNCTFNCQPRMGFECIGRSSPEEGGTGGRAYYAIDILDCTFEASAGEAISYDDDTEGGPGRAGRCRVSGNLVKGAGVGDSYEFGKVFEINGNHDMVVTGNTFHAGRDGILNLHMRDAGDCGWVFSGNVVDASHIAEGIDVSDVAQPVYASEVHGGVFRQNKIINHDAWNIAYIIDCHGMDWRTTRWLGPNNEPYQVDSSGNRF